MEIGDGKRFRSAQHLARDAGVVPQVQSSGGMTWWGSTMKDCNHSWKRASYGTAHNGSPWCAVPQKRRARVGRDRRRRNLRRRDSVMQTEEVQAAEVGRIATNWRPWRQPRNSLIPQPRRRGSAEGQTSACASIKQR
ncbi:MAG: transposase [Acidobacteriota bacterium]